MKFGTIAVAVGLFLFSFRAWGEALELPASGVWNGFHEQVNVIECSNIDDVTASLRLDVKGNSGTALGDPIYFSLPAHGTQHIVLNTLPIQESYGSYTISSLGGAPLISCLTAIYRMSPPGASEAVEYAFALPVENPLRGESFGIYNSFNPGGADEPVLNWFSIYNPGNVSFDGTVELYRADGSIDQARSFPVSDLAPGERRDFALGHNDGQVVGIYRIVPDNDSQSYGAFLTRYGRRDAQTFAFAFPLMAAQGACDLGSLPASTMDPATNWGEIANPTDSPINTEIKVWDVHGNLLHEETRVIEPRSQYHLHLNSHIGERSIGSFRAHCIDPGSGKLLAQSAYYGRLSPVSSEIEWAYATQPPAGGVANGVVAVSAVNTYFAAANWFKISSESTTLSEIHNIVYGFTGNAVFASETQLPPAGSFDFGVHGVTTPDFVGMAVACEDSKSDTFQSELIRVFPHAQGGIGSIMRIPVTTVEQDAVSEICVANAPRCDYVINPGESINRYSDVVQPGQSVCIHGGTYAGPLVLERSGASGASITFRAFPGEECLGAPYTYDGEAPEGPPNCQVIIDGGGIDLAQKSFIRVEGFEIINYDGLEEGAAIACQSTFDSESANVEIINNYIHHNLATRKGNGIYCPAVQGGLIADNYITDTGNDTRGLGIGIRSNSGERARNVTISGNVILRMACDGMDIGGDEIIIENNILGDSYDGDCHQDAIEIITLSNSIIRNNIIYDYTQLIYGGPEDGSAGEWNNIEIYGNVLFTDQYWTGQGGDAPAIWAYAATGGNGPLRNITIHSNTFGWTGLPAIGIFGEDRSPVTGIRIYNNIFYDARILIEIDDPNEVTSDYNLFYDSDPDDDWNASPWEAEGSHSIFNRNPRFINYVRHQSHDFRLRSNSPAIDRGNLGPISLPTGFTDFWNTARPLDGPDNDSDPEVDIGAYEYVR